MRERKRNYARRNSQIKFIIKLTLRHSNHLVSSQRSVCILNTCEDVYKASNTVNYHWNFIRIISVVNRRQNRTPKAIWSRSKFKIESPHIDWCFVYSELVFTYFCHHRILFVPNWRPRDSMINQNSKMQPWRVSLPFSVPGMAFIYLKGWSTLTRVKRELSRITCSGLLLIRCFDSYSKTDYALFHALGVEGRRQNSIVVSYDIWCQFSKNLKDRARRNFPVYMPLLGCIRGCVPKLHINGHNWYC